MRRGAGERGFVWALLRSKCLCRCVLGVSLLALLAGLSRLEVSGQNVGSYLGRLLVPPANARKSHARWSRMGETRQLPGQFPAFRQFMSRRGSARHWHAARRAEPGSEPEVFGVSRTFWRVSRSHHGTRRGDATPRPFVHEPRVEGRWDAVVRPTATAAEPRRTEASFRFHHRIPEKLAGRLRPHRAPDRGPYRRLDKTAAVPSPVKRSAVRARPGPHRLGARMIGELLPPVGSYRSDEVLAINLSTADLGRARDRGYRLVERIDLPGFGIAISRLKPPDTLNAVNGREQLFDLLPEGGFTLNRVYAPYRPEAGRAGADFSLAAHSGRRCPPERCFGSALVNWQPRLAACALGVKVGIIDTGFDRMHPAFAGLHYAYREFLPEGSERASNRHGTAVLALLAGNADSGTPGLIPDASYVIANAFFADADGEPVSDTTEMLRALHWLKENGVTVVNLSFAGPEDELVHHAVQELTRSGTVVVAAAGNEGPAAPPSYPAAYEEVIAVTAVDRNLAAYRYANRGDQIDVAAPGVDVWTAVPGRREGPQTGTSFAVPYVTAVVAVELPRAGVAPDADPRAAKRQVLAQLEGNVRSLGGRSRNPIFGAGLVQAPATCGPAPAMTVAANTPAAPQPWAGTIVRAADPSPREPVVWSAWMSTVRAEPRDALPR
jgi:hypothetical protein